MLDRDKFLVVSEHGFLIQLEKGDIEKCPHYKGDYQCGMTRRSVRSLDSLPKGCPVRTEETAHTLCPIIWLLTCMSEGIVQKEEAERIIAGKVDASSFVADDGKESSDRAVSGPAGQRSRKGAGRTEGGPDAGNARPAPATLDEELDRDGRTAGGGGTAEKRQKTFSAPPEVDQIEADGILADARKAEERARSLWLESEGRAKALDEREVKLADAEAKLAGDRSELDAEKESLLSEKQALERERGEIAQEKKKPRDSGQGLAGKNASSSTEEELRIQAGLLAEKAERLSTREAELDARAERLSAMENQNAGGKAAGQDADELSAIRTALEERERLVEAAEKAAAERSAETERLNAESRENHEKAVKLLELVKKKDAKVTQKIMALNKAQREGTAPPEGEEKEDG